MRLEMFSFRSKRSLSPESMHCVRQGFQSFKEFMIYLEFLIKFSEPDTVAFSSVNVHVNPVSTEGLLCGHNDVVVLFFQEDAKNMI